LTENSEWRIAEELQPLSVFIQQHPRLRVLSPHSSEKVLGMLIKILCRNHIAAQGCCLCQGQGSMVMPFGIGKAVASSIS
jgi:hypothetical protein